MTWSIQLTPWALPALLAVLLVMRDVGYLWPRRREPVARALLSFAGTAGVWALLHLVAVTAPSMAVKAGLARIQYLPAALAPVLWAWFALVYTRRDRRRPLWPMAALCVLSAVTILVALLPPTVHWLLRDAALTPIGTTTLLGLTVRHGAWHWVHIGTRVVAVSAATALVAGKAARTPGARGGAGWAIAAGLLALAPAVAHLALGSGAAWADLSAAGFATASATLTAGLLHRRLLELGPVARTLVMVELRDPIVVLDAKGHIVDVNRAAENLLGLRPYGDVPLDLGKLWARSRQEPGVTATMVLPVRDESGHRPFDVTVTPLGDRGTAVRSAMVFRDVTTRVRMEEELQATTDELRRLANSDALTGLANRRHFMEALDREVERAGRYGRALSLVLVDLDHFKKVNDTWGHAAGDEVLKDAAQALRSVCRDLDLPARLGGEELVLLLPETDGEGARVVAERARERIQATEHAGADGRAFRVTASMGVACFGEQAATVAALLQVSDEALYAAKKAGRNRVVLSS